MPAVTVAFQYNLNVCCWCVNYYVLHFSIDYSFCTCMSSSMQLSTCSFYLFILTVISLGDVTGQFTAAPPTCPGETFTFRCTVTGNQTGLTIWRVNSREGESNRCNMIHRTLSSPICGPGNVFAAISGAGFGTSGPSYLSTLSGTATPSMDGTLIECFGPANSVDPDNNIGYSTLQIVGQCMFILERHALHDYWVCDFSTKFAFKKD